MAEVRSNCPMCPSRGFPPDRAYHLYTNMEKRVFICFRCGWKGRIDEGQMPRSPWRMKTRMESSSQARENAMRAADINPLPSEPETRFQAECVTYLQGRGINLGQIRTWRLHYAVVGPYGGRVIFPCYGPGGLEFFVARAINDRMEPKTLHPAKGGVWPGKSEVVWGLNDVSPEAQEIVICEGVFDAAVAPNGVAIFGKFLSRKQMTMILMRSQYVAIMLDGDAMDEARQIKRKIRAEFPRSHVRTIELPRDSDPSDLGAIEVHKLLA